MALALRLGHNGLYADSYRAFDSDPKRTHRQRSTYYHLMHYADYSGTAGDPGIYQCWHAPTMKTAIAAVRLADGGCCPHSVQYQAWDPGHTHSARASAVDQEWTMDTTSSLSALGRLMPSG
jgi:hypothetical protein